MKFTVTAGHPTPEELVALQAVLANHKAVRTYTCHQAERLWIAATTSTATSPNYFWRTKV